MRLETPLTTIFLFLILYLRKIKTNMDIDLKNIRKESGLSMRKVAENSGLDVTRVFLAETKTENRTIKMVEKVANALGYELTLKKKEQ